MTIVVSQPIQYYIKVTHPAGLKIRDRAASQSDGAHQVGAALPPGSTLLAYDLLSPNGVMYAHLLSDDPQHPMLFARVAEVGGYNPLNGQGTYCKVTLVIYTEPTNLNRTKLLQVRDLLNQVLSS